MELGKIPPHDTEAEQAVLGSMLTDKEAIISAIEILKEEDFYREDNKAIYGAILNLYNRAEPIDVITLKAELSSLGKLDAVGGLEYLAELPIFLFFNCLNFKLSNYSLKQSNFNIKCAYIFYCIL